MFNQVDSLTSSGGCDFPSKEPMPTVTLEQFHPQCEKPGSIVTLGDYIELASKVAGVSAA